MKLPLLKQNHAARDALIDKASQHAEAGRRLAMYDRQTGLFAYWYFMRRFEEESRRAQRYSRPLATMLVDVRKDDGYQTQDAVTAWLDQELRATDLASHLGDGRYMVLLTETPLAAAAAIAARLTERFPQAVAVGVACYPEDGADLDEIKQAAEHSARGNWALSA